MAATVSSPHFGSLGLSMCSLLETLDGVTGTGQGRAGQGFSLTAERSSHLQAQEKTEHFPVLNRGLGAPRSLTSQIK